MTISDPTVLYLFPEIVLFTAACTLLMITVFSKNVRIVSLYAIAQVALIISAFVVMMTFYDYPQVLLHGNYITDHFGRLLKLFMLVITFIVFTYSREFISEHKVPHGEYFVLALLSLVGMMVLASANSFLLIYLGLELLSLPLYALIAIFRDQGRCTEAAMKYFIMGALASGMLLFGMSLIYGATGDLNLVKVAHDVIASQGYSQAMIGFGLVFCVVGTAFKLGLVPFHMWVPDVYEGAPVSMTLFVGTAPKLAAFAMLARILFYALPTVHDQWQMMCMVLAVLSIGIGNVVAIAQTNIKRMLAYSSIAHMGYMLLGVMSGSLTGFGAALFYIICYGLMSAAAFGMVTLLSHKGIEAENIEDFRGLGNQSPWLAFMMLIVMFSMAGIPPTVGFFAKMAVLSAIISSGHITVAVIALLFAVVGSFYYLRVIKTMYFEDQDKPLNIVIEWDARMILSLNALALLALGVFPASLMHLCRAVLGG